VKILCLSSFYLLAKDNIDEKKRAFAEGPSAAQPDGTASLRRHAQILNLIKTYCSFAVKSYLYTSQNQALWNTILKR
jgi:hypothetical protein